MKYFLSIAFLACITSIVLGFVLTVSYSEKLIGFGVVGLFFVVIPVFTYVSWKGKNPKDYMLTKEKLEQMRKKQNQ